MRSRCAAVALVPTALLACQMCWADDVAGKLERVDHKTVTVRCMTNRIFVFEVDPENRLKAAPYLGKSVTVTFRTEAGQCRAVLFKAAQ